MPSHRFGTKAPTSRRTPGLKILDLNWLDWFSEFESKYLRIKIKLTIERTLNIFRLSEAVLFTGERNVRHRNSLRADRIDHRLRLIRRDHFVFQSLKKDHRT